MNKIQTNGLLVKTGKVYNDKHVYTLTVKRKSDTVDSLLVLSEQDQLPEGSVHVEGEIHAEYIKGVGVPPFICPDSVMAGEDDGSSHAELMGIVKKKPECRKTKSGISLATVVLDTEAGPIPVLLWGVNAKKSEAFEPGDCLKVAGRLQSRDYPDRHKVWHTAYELSTKDCEVCSSDNE